MSAITDKAAMSMANRRMNALEPGLRTFISHKEIVTVGSLNVQRFKMGNGAGAQNRTVDLLITNQLLYP